MRGGGEEQSLYLLWVDRGAMLIEALAVALIIIFIMLATFSWLSRSVSQRGFTIEQYVRYRGQLGRALLIGLEILVAADVVRTVALEPTLVNVATLGLLVIIRTFLSWSIVLEVEGRWPWQPRPTLDSEQKNV
jgi:uncharacterized membrane protein